jgi:hypothetical protein
MKKGRRVKLAGRARRGHGGLAASRCGAGLLSLSPPDGRTRLDGRLAPVAHLLRGPSCGHGGCGACRGERAVVGEHLPDGLGEAAGEVDLGDLGAALLAEAELRSFVAVAVGGVVAGVARGFDQRPAQVAGPVLAERAAAVALAGLVDAWAEAAVAGQLARGGEAGDVADLGGDRVGEHPGDPGDRGQKRHVAMVGPEPPQRAFAGGDLLVELGSQKTRSWPPGRQSRPPAATRRSRTTA